MQASIKDIKFRSGSNAKSFFDLVTLQDILLLQPTDHNQFEHHKLTFYVLLLITEGSGKHSINFIEHSYKRGSVFALRPDSIHKFHPSDANGRLLIFTEDFVLQYLSEQHAGRIFQLFNEQLASPKQQLSEAEFVEITTHFETINQECFRIQDNFSSEVIGALLQIIITQLLRAKAGVNEVFNNTRYLAQFLEFQTLVEQHGQENRSVAFYANELNVTARTLNNITQSIVHKSAKAVIADVLISQIKGYLINSSLNVTQIAYEMGFHEPSHLFKFFKTQTGFSPRKFRESLH